MLRDTVALARSRASGHRFYASMVLVAIVLVVAAFAPSIVEPSSRLAPLTPLVIAHALVFVGWLLLFLVQALLAATHRIALHRRLGALAGILALVMVLTATSTSIQMARRGSDLSGDLGGAQADMPVLLALQLGDTAAFAVLVVAGLSMRHRPDVHKRLMLMATLSPFTLMGAPLAHLRGHWPNLAVATLGIVLVLQFSTVIHDRVTRGHVHPASWWGSLSLLAWGMVRGIVIIPSDVWRAVTATLSN
jgi:hypothetical protein